MKLFTILSVAVTALLTGPTLACKLRWHEVKAHLIPAQINKEEAIWGVDHQRAEDWWTVVDRSQGFDAPGGSGGELMLQTCGAKRAMRGGRLTRRDHAFHMAPGARGKRLGNDRDVFLGFVEALSPISVKGTKLFDDDGNQFFIRGVAYTFGDDDPDPLLDTKRCQADATLMKTASINTIYVYWVDSEQDHEGCMKAFADQGIYVWLQLGSFPRVTSLTQTTPPWTLPLYAVYTSVLDAFALHPNTLALGLGQETITANSTSTLAAPALKAAARDLHAFLAARGYRPIPLSYSAADVASLRDLTAQYLTCDSGIDDDGGGGGQAGTIDLLGLNVFLSCGADDWRALHAQFAALDLPVPVAISEAGCRSSGSGSSADDTGARDFADASLVLGPEMRDVFCGVSVFEWAMRSGASKFGVVEYEGGGAGKGEAKTLAQFGVLSGVYGAAAKVTVTATGTGTGESSAAATTTRVVACPTKDVAKGWLVEAGAVLPSIEGLQIGTVTVRTTVTQGRGSTATSVAGEGQDGGGARDKEEMVDEPPPSYTYPEDKVELPEQSMSAVEMDGMPHSATTTGSGWQLPMQGAGQDSTTLTELPDRKWRRTTYHELDDNFLARMAGEPAGTSQVSPLTPGTAKYA
ncbi:hypothetical protein NEMBOFW57_009409 [Staphylotrichum longicolle]|uniref:1,3-beta-glucanosyltransferase n=1 Tax=Staphylotrichum longicolle TaxID=669026 RepID=A0AAD4EPB6_9PEZI|nr:hypothetical protein NEMBOFW57_009409 [Staphylotrichum longicolle]